MEASPGEGKRLQSEILIMRYLEVMLIGSNSGWPDYEPDAQKVVYQVT